MLGIEAVFSTTARQKAEDVISTSALLAANAKIKSGIFLSKGFDSLVGLVVSDQPGTLRILQAAEVITAGVSSPGEFVQTQVITTSVDAFTGRQTINVVAAVIGAYIQLQYENGGAPQTDFSLIAYLMPIYSPGAAFTAQMVTIVGTPNVNVVNTPSVTIAGGPIPVITNPNRPTFATNQKDVAVPGTAVNIPAQAMPDGFQVAIIAKKTNTKNIYLGNSLANAQNHAVADILAPGDVRKLAITNWNLMWIDADMAGEGVTIISET